MKRASATATLSTRRLEAFTDGVFAIAATLLVLDLTVNDLGSPKTEADLWAGLVDMWPAIISFTISFLLLCMLWTVHVRQFEYIVRVDSTMILLNTLRLFGVVLIPFTTSLSGQFNDLWLGRILLPINFFWVVLFGYVQWARATDERRGMTEGLDPDAPRRSRRNGLSAVILGGVAVVLSPFLGSWAFLAYALDAPLSRLLGGSAGRGQGQS